MTSFILSYFVILTNRVIGSESQQTPPPQSLTHRKISSQSATSMSSLGTLPLVFHHLYQIINFVLDFAAETLPPPSYPPPPVPSTPRRMTPRESSIRIFILSTQISLF